MDQQNLQNNWNLTSKTRVILATIAVLALLSVKLLFFYIMAVNEVDVLPLARQYADPTWIPGDWYLNQPAGYRQLFQALFGRLIVSLGFLSGSIVGRFICYSLVASGLVLIGRKLGLNLFSLLLGVSLFLLRQSAAAGEWLVGGLETKAVAYGLILLAIGLMLSRRYRLMALMLGLATSFHILVGAYAFLTVLGWFILRRKTRFPSMQEFGLILLIYLAASAFGLKSVIEQLLSPTPTGALTPSFFYVFIRLPHHLNPLSWPFTWWVIPLIYLVILVGSVRVIWLNRPSKELSEPYTARIELFEFTLISLVPFILGLVIAPFDSQGRLLQYYPFRLGDVMLPLNTCLLFACAVQPILTGKRKLWALLGVLCLLLTMTFVPKSSRLPIIFQSLSQFPGQQQEVNPQWKDMCNWIRNNTQKDAVIVSAPAELNNFSWLTERATVAKFKLLPQSKAGILNWSERMRDLSGDFAIANPLSSLKGQLLSDGYNRLTTNQAKTLIAKYQASYLVTRIQHQLDLPIAYRNQSYVLYKK